MSREEEQIAEYLFARIRGQRGSVTLNFREVEGVESCEWRFHETLKKVPVRAVEVKA